jgi:myo-inositol-1(or 4)-monophosphatase
LPAADLALLAEAARAAGRIALSFFRKSPEIWEKHADAGPVTEADYAVDRMLRDTLTGARPGYGWLSEETEDGPARLARPRSFIVDPIDGTRAFIAGEPSWAHSLAVVEAGQATAGVVYLPVPDLLYAATLGGGATLNGQPIRASGRTEETGATVLAGKTAFHPDLWPGGLPQIERKFRPSLAWRLALVGEGRFDAMLTLRPAWEWDIAAGALIAAEAGARVTDRHGGPLRFNSPHPQTAGVIAAAPALHAAFLARLAPADG